MELGKVLCLNNITLLIQYFWLIQQYVWETQNWYFVLYKTLGFDNVSVLLHYALTYNEGLAHTDSMSANG